MDLRLDMGGLDMLKLMAKYLVSPEIQVVNFLDITETKTNQDNVKEW